MPSATRREFLRQSGSCVSHLALVAAAWPPALRARWSARSLGPVVAVEPFGRLEKVSEGIWALISTPLGGDFTTVSNGGIIAGTSGVMVIEGLMQPAGATWLANQAKSLTGRWPTHVVISHYHSDHANGVAGYGEGGPAPKLLATQETRDRARDKNQPADPARTARLADAVILDPSAATTIDLGGRSAKITPLSGHTASDLVVALDDPAVTFAGDLIWSGMFPNYVDAVPTRLAATVRALKASQRLYVPGHGPLAKPDEVDRYLAVLDAVEAGARKAIQDGKTAADGAAGFTLPASLGEWVLFNKRFMETAFVAWYRELGR